MIEDFFDFMKDVMIILLILVGMVLLLFGLRHLLPHNGNYECDDTHNADFRKEIRASNRVLGQYNLFRRFFDVSEDASHTPSIPEFYQRGKRSADESPTKTQPSADNDTRKTVLVRWIDTTNLLTTGETDRP